MKYIERDAAIRAVLKYGSQAAVAAVQEIKPINPHGELREMLIDEMIDRMGEWEERYIDDANPMFRRRFYCSRCGEWTTYGKTRYCPNCGARMANEQKRNEEILFGGIENV